MLDIWSMTMRAFADMTDRCCRRLFGIYVTGNTVKLQGQTVPYIKHLDLACKGALKASASKSYMQ